MLIYLTNKTKYDNIKATDKEYNMLNNVQLGKLNQDFEGTELCPHCGHETNYVINPTENIFVTCSYCGVLITPCSLCNGCTDRSCRENILNSLWDYNYTTT